MHTVTSKHHMIVKRDADEFASSHKPLCLINVFIRRRGVSAWMIMRNDDRHRTKADCITKYLTRMQKRLIRRTT